jgi:hypothetical protein
MEEELSKEVKEKILDIVIRATERGCSGFSQSEAIILFHWVRHRNDPIYSFVPEKYRKF